MSSNKTTDKPKGEKVVQVIEKSYSSKTTQGKDGVPVTERLAKTKRLLVNKEGDVLEEKEKYQEIPSQKKILKSDKQRINEQSRKLKEETNTETKETKQDKKLKNLKEEEVPQFEKKWDQNAKEYKMLQGKTAYAIKS